MSQTKAQLIGDLTQALEFITTASTPADGLYLKATNQIALATNSVDRITVGTSELVINESGASVDFRVEGDTNANLLFVDASADRVGIGTSSPGHKVEIAGTSGSAVLGLLESGVRSWGIRAGGAVTNAFDIADFTAGATRLTIDSSGRVGIGTTSPNNLLTLNSNTANTAITIQSSNSGDAAVVFGDQDDFSRGRIKYENSTDALAFETNNLSEAARIDSSGRLLVGLTSNQTDDPVQVRNTDGRGLAFFRNSSANAIANGQVKFVGSQGTTAAIMGRHDGSQSSGSAPGRLEFYTTPSGSTNPTERMRITHDGVVDLGQDGGQARIRANAADQHQFSRTSTATTNLQFIEFGRAGTAPGNYTPVGDIRTNGSGNLAFNSVSDISLKENIRDLDNCLETINSLRPVLFDWKESVRAGCTDVKGFIAQELEQVLPKSVNTDENGLKSIAPETELFPLLVGALKEATIKIETLEAKVAALETN